MRISHREHDSAFALILTLATLVIAAVLVVGFVSSMRTERQAAASMAENERAKLIAQSALSNAIALLDANIPQPAPPAASPYPIPPAPAPAPAQTPVNWIVNPGRLTLQPGPSPAFTPIVIPLSSNPSATYVSTAGDANLNPAALSGSGYATLGVSNEMRVAWIPILQDPTSAPSATNPIVGRYAFWIDDENARVDLNTAYGKAAMTSGPAPQVVPTPYITVNSTTYPVGHPSSINIDTLDSGFNKGGFASSQLRLNAARGNIVSVSEAKAYFSSTAAFDANKFFLGTLSSDPEFNVFGKSRLFFARRVTRTALTDQVNQFPFDWEAATYFGREENRPGGDEFSLYRTAAVISNILNRNDWPGMPTRSFVQKWGGAPPGTPTGSKTTTQLTADREADQIAWNIMAVGGYGNSDAPSANNAEGNNYMDYQNLLTTGPGATGSAATNFPNCALQVGRLSGKAMLPAFPKPGIQEIALTVNPILRPGGRAWVKLDLQSEFYNGNRFPTSKRSDTSSGTGFFLTYISYTVTTTDGATSVSQTDNAYLLPTDSPTYRGLNALYGYIPTAALTPFNPNTYEVVSTNSGKSIYTTNGSGINTATPRAFPFSQTDSVNVQLKMRLVNKYSFGGGSGMPIQVIPIWDSRDPGPPVGPASLQPPSGETDYVVINVNNVPLSGGPTTASIEVPVPQLAGRSESWTPTSSPTLGIQNAATTAAGDVSKLNAFDDLLVGNYTGSEKPSIGLLSVVPTGMQRGLTTTVKLQPSTTTTDLPDWLLLDLLASSAESPVSVNNSAAGKINVNAQIYPTGGSFAPPQRTLSLQAVFQNIGSVTPSAIASNILNHTLAAGGNNFGVSDAYDYVGEICEIAGVADSAASSEWDKEFVIRNFAGCFTTKSNAFRVIGVGQAIKKKPGNTNYATFELSDIITGEKRFESVVQRYFWQGKDSNHGNAHTATTGVYDRLSTTPGYQTQTGPFASPDYATNGTWEQIDGPDPPTYSPYPSPIPKWGSVNYSASGASFQVKLELADNPLRSVAKYRVAYFHYLDE